MRLRVFSEQVRSQIILLESLINLEQVNTSVVKKRRILSSKTLMVRITGQVVFSLYANESCDEHVVYFR